MDQQQAVSLIRESLLATFWLSLPLLAIGFLVGVVMSLLQVLTSIQDSAFSAVPRLGAFLVGVLLLLPWMISRWSTYTLQLWSQLPGLTR
jgi:flagellar biosynthetic protein FliQ